MITLYVLGYLVLGLGVTYLFGSVTRYGECDFASPTEVDMG